MGLKCVELRQQRVHSSTENVAMEIRQVLTDEKSFGRQQMVQWFWLGACNLVNSMHLVISVFISASVDFRCKLPRWDNDTYAIQNDLHNSSIQEHIPLLSGNERGYNSCYVAKTAEQPPAKCDSYVYDRSQFIDTTTTQFNLVCDRQQLSTNAGTIYMAGLLVGSIAFGAISDRFGRKWTIYAGLCLQGAIALSIRFSPNFEVFVILRFLLGAINIGGLVTQYTLMVEICPASKRTLSAICQTIGWAIGVMVLSGAGYLIRSWRDLQLCVTCFSIPYMLTYWWLLDESPTWLLSQGRVADAVKIVERIKKLNRLDYIDTENLVDTEVDEKQANESWRDIFKARTLLLNILFNCFGWFVASMGYYGLALNVGNLVGDLYINNFVGGLVEVPAYFLLLLCIKYGRKLIYIPLMSIGGVALIVSAFLIVYLKDAGLNWLIITVSMVGKFAVSAGFELVYFWSAEAYPTSMRNSMLGVNSASARVGSMISPTLANIPQNYPNLPFAHGVAPFIFGGFMVAAAMLAFFLPETNNAPIPETIEEANQFTYKYRVRNGSIDLAKPNIEMTSKKELVD